MHAQIIYLFGIDNIFTVYGIGNNERIITIFSFKISSSH